MGDYNDLLSNDDKRRQVDHPPWQLRGFQEAVMDSNLHDIPLEGYQFTWFKSRGYPHAKEERLDRALATPEWLDVFPTCSLRSVVIDRSDHYPILLRLYERDRRRAPRTFKFENAWLDEKELKEVVKNGWEEHIDGDLMSRMKRCTEGMNVWGKKLRSNYKIAIDACKRELEGCCEEHHGEDGLRFSTLRDRLGTLLAQEEAFWKQRAKVFLAPRWRYKFQVLSYHGQSKEEA